MSESDRHGETMGSNDRGAGDTMSDSTQAPSSDNMSDGTASADTDTMSDEDDEHRDTHA
ncbi:MAG TPA: hypothetical protein VHX87_05975 [Galbitalea sp.]|jgi:hypothetical protein|nr:hypothetical protein [Galbitalea sp.]